MTDKSFGPIALTILTLALTSSVIAQDQAPAQGEPEAPMVVKVYRIANLITGAPSYPYEGTYLPSGPRYGGSPTQLAGQMGGGMGGMGGGMGGMGGGASGGGMGGGMFQVGDKAPAPAAGGPMQRGARAGGVGRITIQQLVDAITTVIDPASWDEVGGPGSIQEIGSALAIRQTAEVQAKVEKFLQELGRESGQMRAMQIKARWLLLDDQQLATLAEGGDKKQAALGQLRREGLTALPADTQRYAGQVSCFDGQTVYLISGELRSVVQSYIPIAGSAETGYQPVVSMPHLGAFLQCTPTWLSDEKAVFVNLHSSVTRWENATSSAKSSSTKAPKGSQYPEPLDHLRIAAQQFATSVRVPLNEPVLVGGMTYPGGKDEADGQLYLVLEINSPEM